MEQFANFAADYGWSLNDQQRDQFTQYQELLLEWNKRINLTATIEPEQIKIRHFLDSLTCATVTKDLNHRTIIDVGTGAGFPGLPLKILYPQSRLTLVESVTKKTQFLETVVQKLMLKDVTIIADRAEVIGRQIDHRGRYDWVVSRGVAQLRVLVEYLMPLCRKGGKVLAQKGKNAMVETAEAKEAIILLGGETPELHQVHLPGREETHYLVVIKKVADTPARFPRRSGIPSKRPL